MLSKKIIILGSTLILSLGCTPDRGSYDYIKLNEVDITGIDEDMNKGYAVNRFNELNIPVTLNFSQKDESNFEYLWYIYSIGDPKIDTISREKDLKYVFNNLPKRYEMIYKVIDKKHDVYYSKKMALRVINTIDEGFMMLGAMGDSLNINMVNASGILSKDMYRNSNGKYLATAPENIYHFVPSNTGYYIGREYVTVTHEGGKATLFDPINFINVASEKDMFILPPSSIRIDGYITGYWHDDILVNAGKLHLRRYDVPYNAAITDDELGYEASTVSVSGGPFFCVYDKLNRRFITANSDKTKVETMQLTRKSKPFDIANVKKDLIAAKCLSNGFTNALMRDDDGTLNIAYYVLREESGTTKMQFTSMTPINKSLEINRAKEFTFTSDDSSMDDLVYFKDGDSKIYHYNISGIFDEVSGVVTHESEVLDINDGGDDLSIEKIYAANGQWAVAYRDNSINTKRNVGIIIYNAVKVGDRMVLSKRYKFGELTEKAVGIAYKFSTI